MRSLFVKDAFFSAPRTELFSFHERPDAFRLLTPASHHVSVGGTVSTLKPSDEVARFTIKFLLCSFSFEMIHTSYEYPSLFVDEQRKGLFSSWRHEHRFREGGWEGDPASMLQDRIQYSHPLLFLFNPLVKRRLESLFRYRHKVTSEALQATRDVLQPPTGRPKVVITGATGLIGRRIAEILREKGARVVAFVRSVPRARTLLGEGVTCGQFDFTRPELGDWKQHLQEANAVIHLAGTPLFKQRWSPAFKQEMESSRTQSTRLLVDAIAAARDKPESFVTASAVGIYGLNPTLQVDEDSEHADNILARICTNWEREARRVEETGVRSVQVRTGIVLSPQSGALKEMLPLFSLGMGGVLGDADSWINWIHIEDIARIFVMAVFNKELSGPYNAVAPNPVTNGAFARAVARTMHRPCFMRYPKSLLKLAIGEAAEYASGGPPVSVERLRHKGYRFFFEDLEPALESLLLH